MPLFRPPNFPMRAILTLLSVLFVASATLARDSNQKPPGAAEIHGSCGRNRFTIAVVKVDGKQPPYLAGALGPIYLQPGMHQVELSIVGTIWYEGGGTFDLLAQENRKYRFTVFADGGTEFTIVAHDFTKEPEEIVFVARVPWNRIPHQGKPTYIKAPSYLAVPAVLSSKAPSGKQVPYGKTYGTMDTPPAPEKQERAKYPPELKARGIEGAAVVKFELTAAEGAKDFSVQASSPEFGEAAMAAARLSRFKPAKQAGKNVSCKIELLYTFPGQWVE